MSVCQGSLPVLCAWVLLYLPSDIKFHGDGDHTYTPRTQGHFSPTDLRLGSVIVKGLEDAQCSEHSSSLPSLC